MYFYNAFFALGTGDIYGLLWTYFEILFIIKMKNVENKVNEIFNREKLNWGKCSKY